MLKIALVTNELPPYRTPVFSRLARLPDVELHVIACIDKEPIRHWNSPALTCAHTILKPSYFTFQTRFIHHNWDVFAALRACSPDVVVTDGFNPTHLYAFAYARAKGCAHVAMTDGTLESESILTSLHRLARREVYRRSQAFVAASRGGQALFDSYGVARGARFTSCLAIDNDAFAKATPTYAPYDLMFSGRMVPVKNPLFVLDVGVAAARRLGRPVRILMAGSGAMEEEIRAHAALFPGLIDVHLHGFAAQEELPGLYKSARVFMFPSRWDPWGVVANEACAAGLPVLISPHAGAANELVRDGENGYVLELDLEPWTERAAQLLTDPALCERMGARGQEIVSGYTFDRAARGIADACRYAWARWSSRAQFAREFRSRPRVLIVERQLLQYRVGFYQRLREQLEREGIELQLLVGEGTPKEKMKRNEAELPWAIRIPTRYFLGYRVCWQPFGKYARQSDLVIVMHENKIIYNLWLMLARPTRLAFWGHGANLQSDRPDGWKERFKRWTVRRADWWFAYTDMSARMVADAGFPPERTTVVENAIDTEELRALCEQVTPEMIAAERQRLRLQPGPVGLYLGSLYKEKRLDFLIDAACRIRAAVPDFQLLVAGAGPEQVSIEEAARQHPWIHPLGPVQGQAKALALRMADVILNPGLVGLGILDSFASGRPMFTTDCGLHSPEISYLRSGSNGVMTENDVTLFAAAVEETLRHPDRMERLILGAKASAEHYTVENMASRICRGIQASLSMT
ncbi:MAG TPA: glycosyltransferase family 4 protein [Telluria sp.]|nr:glycosyltransferase family 4 protein [Telluria sp.]